METQTRSYLKPGSQQHGTSFGIRLSAFIFHVTVPTHMLFHLYKYNYGLPLHRFMSEFTGLS
jgi:hypothetical protein